MKVLTIYTMSGCEACTEAKPIFQDFSRNNLGKVLCINASISVRTVSVTGLKPKATPTYELSDEKRETIKVHEGLLDGKGLKEFVFGDLGKTLRKSK